jgi:hypothetical protein
MTTELTTYNDQMPALPSDAPLGYESVDLSSVPTPRIRLMQSISQAVKDNKAKPGQLQNSLTGDVIESGEEFVFIKYSKGAVLFEERGGGLICKSNDGVKNTQGDSCEKCPHNSYYANWGDDKKPPRCSETVNLLAVRRSTILSDMPDLAIVTMSRLSYRQGMAVVASAAIKQKPLYLWSYKLNAESLAKFNGAFAYRPQSNGYVTNAEMEVLVAIAKRFADEQIESDEGAVEDVRDTKTTTVDDF